MRRSLVTLLAVCLAAFVAAPAKSDDLPPGAGQMLVQNACSPCHLATEITSQHKTTDQWADTVSQMIMLGATISDSDYEKIVAYLAHNFGPADAAGSPSK